MAAAIVCGAFGCSQRSSEASVSSSATTAPSEAPSGNASATPAAGVTATSSASAPPAAEGPVAALLREAHAHLDDYDDLHRKRVEVDGVVRALKTTSTGGSEGFPPQIEYEVLVTDPGAAAGAEPLRCKMNWHPALQAGDRVHVTGTGMRDAPDPDGKNRDRFVVVGCVAEKRDAAKP